jgi:hypothetical protein
MVLNGDKKDTPTCRKDLIQKAAESTFPSDFDWISDKEANRVTNDASNRWLTATAIRELARDFIKNGGEIKCTPEKREPYKDRRHFHYDIVISGFPDDFPHGLYVEMELNDPDENEPVVKLLNAHPERRL